MLESVCRTGETVQTFLVDTHPDVLVVGAHTHRVISAYGVVLIRVDHALPGCSVINVQSATIQPHIDFILCRANARNNIMRQCAVLHVQCVKPIVRRGIIIQSTPVSTCP